MFAESEVEQKRAAYRDPWPFESRRLQCCEIQESFMQKACTMPRYK